MRATAILLGVLLCGCNDNNNNDNNGDNNGNMETGDNNGGNNDTGTKGGGGATGPQEVSCSNAAPDVEISITDNAFTPSSPTVPAGGVVRWTHNGVASHSVTSGTAGSSSSGDDFDSGTLTSGDQYCLQFRSTGSFDYHCQFHPTEMFGTITVR